MRKRRANAARLYIFLLQSGALCGIIHHGVFNGMARPRKSESLRTHADRKARAR